MAEEEKTKKDNSPISENVEPLVSPFNTIGLAFSGGGFRAANFALGVLSYLDHVKVKDKSKEACPGNKTAGNTEATTKKKTAEVKLKSLLENVTFMSSASGGSITTSTYAYFLSQGKTFGAFYKHLFEQLDGTKLLDYALNVLNNKSKWKNTSKQRNLINAFAITYQEKFFSLSNKCSQVGGTFGDLDYNCGGAGKNLHLEELCLNATEFHRGILFRQNVKLKNSSVEKLDADYCFGNFMLHIERDLVYKLKLGDALAASSCFPVGFEPIIFPRDFINCTTADKAGIVARPLELNETELKRIHSKDNLKKIVKQFHSKIPSTYANNINELRLSIKDVKRTVTNPNFHFALMDGGITDNQGIESLVDAHKRRKSFEDENKSGVFKPFDLMLVSDVGSHFMTPFSLPKQIKSSVFLIYSLNKLKWIFVFVSLFLLMFLLGSYIKFDEIASHKINLGWKQDFLLEYFLVVAFIIFLGFIIAIYLLFYRMIKSIVKGNVFNSKRMNYMKNFPSYIRGMAYKYIFKLPVSLLRLIVIERIQSSIKLNSDVFLKRIRFLLYRQFKADSNLAVRFKNNHLYDLTYAHDSGYITDERGIPCNLLNELKYQSPPGRLIQNVAQTAFEMGTTLWFDKGSKKKNRQAALIATGQFTTCYNLLDKVNKLLVSKEKVHVEIDKLEKLKSLLQTHYDKFRDNPFWLYNEIGKNAGIKNFSEQIAATFKIDKDYESLRHLDPK